MPIWKNSKWQRDLHAFILTSWSMNVAAIFPILNEAVWDLCLRLNIGPCVPAPIWGQDPGVGPIWLRKIASVHSIDWVNSLLLFGHKRINSGSMVARTVLQHCTCFLCVLLWLGTFQALCRGPTLYVCQDTRGLWSILRYACWRYKTLL